MLMRFFSLYHFFVEKIICWWRAHVTCSQRTCNAIDKISLRHSWKLNHTVILRVLWVRGKCSVCFKISQGNPGNCCTCSTELVRAYGKRTSLQNCKMHLSVLKDFHKNLPADHPYKHIRPVVTKALIEFSNCHVIHVHVHWAFV